MKKFARIALAVLTLAAVLALGAAAEELEDGTQGARYDLAPAEDTAPVEDAAPAVTPAVVGIGIAEDLDPSRWPQGNSPVSTPNPGGAWASDGADKLADPSYGVNAAADVDEAGKFTSPGALFRYWNREGWPETVGGMWSLDGSMDRMAVAVVDADEAVMADIRALMADPDSLEFASCKYSYAQLEQALFEIETEMKGGARCILGAGRAVRGNDFTANGQPVVRVTISTLYDGAEEWADTLVQRYGGMVELEVGELDMVATAEGLLTETGIAADVVGGKGLDKGQVKSAPAWYLWLLPLAVLGVLGLELGRRHALTLRTADGQTVTAGGRPSRSQVERAVRESSPRPGPDGWSGLEKKLD